ncbi:MAG: hypothetical protein JJU18_07515 [Oceanicaulis sp.]|nr:hypothetical protein [Oceanicaulis sp.]
MRFLAVTAAAAALTGCVRLDMPAPASESWTLARVAETQPGAAPVYVPERRLSREDMSALTAAARTVQDSGERVRAIAAATPDPEEDAETYAARHRARAVPPEKPARPAGS